MSFGIVATVGAAVVGGAVAANGAKKAASTQAAAADRATEAQREMFERQVELQEPWRNAGQQGLNVLQQYLGLTTPQQVQQQAATPVFDEQAYLAANPDVAAELNGGVNRGWSTGQQHYDLWGRAEGRNAPMTAQSNVPGAASAAPAINANQFGSLLKPFGASDFQADPGYAFRQAEQEKALTRAASASGGMGSGKFLKDAMKYSGGLASQEYGAAYDRYNANNANIFNRLASISGIGQTAANQTGAAASSFGSQIGSNIIGAGNAAAAGQVGGANAFNNALSQGSSMYQQGQLMNRLFPASGGGVTPPNPYAGGGSGFGVGGGYMDGPFA